MRNWLLVIALSLSVLPLSAQLVTPRGGASQIVIPAAGAVPGAHGTFFRTDVTLLNYRTDVDQHVKLYWLPQGVSGSLSTPKELTIPKASGVVSEDFVTTIMQQTGLGAIMISAVTEGGMLDANGKLYVTARIWTPQPDATGTVSQTFPAISTSDVTFSRQMIIGQRRDDRYRTNVGIVNLDPSLSQTYQIIAKSGVQESLNVVLPPFSMQQISMTGVATPTLQISVANVTQGPRNGFVSYGSTVDNITGDSWSSLGFVAPPDAN